MKRTWSCEPLDTKMPPISSFFCGRLVQTPILSIRWHTFLWWKNPPKCCTILVWVAACLNFSNILLTSRHTKESWVLSWIFWRPVHWKRGRFAGIFVVSVSELWTPIKNSFLNLSNTKYIEVDALFWAYPMVSLSCWSNLAIRYLLRNLLWISLQPFLYILWQWFLYIKPLTKYCLWYMPVKAVTSFEITQGLYWVLSLQNTGISDIYKLRDIYSLCAAEAAFLATQQRIAITWRLE